MKGVEIGSGDAYPGRWLAINHGTAAGTLPGEATVDPAFGLNAIWIESALKEQAQIQGYTVVEASTVVATHLNHLISQHAAELFGRQEAQQLLDRVARGDAKADGRSRSGVVTLTTLHKVLQNLLDEKVPIRDMRTILETLAEHAPIQSDPHELTAVVRVALGRAITQQWFLAKMKFMLLASIHRWNVCCYRRCRAGADWSQAGGSFTGANSGSAIPSGDVGCAAGIVGEPRAATIIVSLPAPQLAAVSGAVESGTV